MKFIVIVVSAGLAVTVLGGCMGAPALFDVPPLHIGDEAIVEGFLFDKREFALRIEGLQTRFTLDGANHSCLKVSLSLVNEPSHLENLCLHPQTFEHLAGYPSRPRSTSPPVDFPIHFAATPFYESLPLAFHVGGPPWRVGEVRQSTWFGVPLTVTLVGIDGDEGVFSIVFQRFFPNGTADKVETLASFERGRSLPTGMGPYFGEREFTPHLRLRAHAEGQDSLSLVSSGIDWGGLIGALVPLSFPYPDGTTCTRLHMSIKEATDYAVMRDPTLSEYVAGGVLIDASIRLPRPEGLPVERQTGQSIQLTLVLADGKWRTFRVDRLDSEITGSRMEYSAGESGRSGPIPSDVYPPTVVPYCEALGRFLSLRPHTTLLQLHYYEGTERDSASVTPTSLLVNSSWGRPATDLQLHNGASSQRLSLSLVTGTLIEASPEST